mgnify:CR=1 FL=1|tara:strand:+ start:629 stop:1609 length:981 start_codon:yes stop_codon:yes gene_type:complete
MITVLLSVFNGEEWLVECIESILEQSYRDFEFLIIDDGSLDNTLEIIKRYATLDERIRYITQGNMGLTKSLNKGLKIAKGDWIARIDSDDIARPKRLELQLEFALKKKAALVGCQSIIIDNDNSIKRKILVPTEHKKLFSNLQKQKKFFSHSSVFFNKKLILNLGGYREIMKKSQDYDLWLRVSEIKKIGCISYFGNYLRDHKKRISYNSNGIEQRLYSHCANISHRLRTNYGPKYDPLNNNISDKFFIKFVSKNLEITGTLNFYKQLYKFKNKTNNFPALMKIFLIPIYFNKLDLFWKLLIWIVKGDFISKIIAKKWLKLNSKNI